MKITAKTFILFLSLTLVFATTSQAFAGTIPFTDIPNVPEKVQIMSLQEKGIVNGVGGGLYNPYRALTAAQGIQLLVNAFDLNIDNIRFIKAPKASDYFAKADDDAWYANALIIGSITIPDLHKDIDPNQVWTREEFTNCLVTIIERHYNLPKMKLIPISIADENQMTTEYSGAIQRSLSYGIMSLDDHKKFNPKGEITRAQAAAAVYMALEKFGK